MSSLNSFFLFVLFMNVSDIHIISGSYYKLSKYYMNELIYVNPVFKFPETEKKGSYLKV